MTRSIATGAGYAATDWILGQLAELARSVGGEWDPNDDPNPTEKVDGCRKVETYNQLYYNDGTGWKPAGQTGSQTLTAQAVEITKTDLWGPGANGEIYAQCTFKTVNYGEVAVQEGNGGQADAANITWRIGLDLSACIDEGPGPYEDWEPIQLPDQVVDNCTINVTFHGFVGNEDGTGKLQPVFRITPAAGARAGGGVIGGCNFEPTILIGGGGDGDDPPRTLPDPPDEPGSDGWWQAIVGGLIGGLTSSIVTSVVNALLNEQSASSFTLQAPCDVDEEGNALTYTVDFPAEGLQERILRWQVAQAYLLQQHLNWKTPICGDETAPLDGQFRTISFRSEETSPYGKSRLRKRLRYRSNSGLGLADLIDHWANFTFTGGPVRVRHTGSPWGTVEVWAASEDEGKRVIRHAAGEAGIDPDQVGRWSTRSSNSARLGVSLPMRVDTTGGYYWITERDGSDNRPMVGKISPEQLSGADN